MCEIAMIESKPEARSLVYLLTLQAFWQEDMMLIDAHRRTDAVFFVSHLRLGIRVV